MSRTLLGVGLAGAVFLSAVPVAQACGDKLLALSRGIRFQRAYMAPRPASILLYAERTHTATPLKEPKLHSTLKQAGHKLRLIESSGELELALRSGQYDLVLVDPAGAAAMKPRTTSAPNKPLVLPVFTKPTKNELKAAEKEYGFYLLGPDKPIECLVAIDLAMKARAQSARSS